MNFPRRSSQVTPKIVNLYTKLFKGIPVHQISGPNQTRDQFYAELLTLDLDKPFISGQLEGLSRDDCLGPLKSFLNSWFMACIHWARSGSYEDVKKLHALETLAIIIRGIFSKSLAGWEIMEALAGSVNESDSVFMEFTNVIADIQSDPNAPAHVMHLSLQLGLIYMCGARQTSLGSFFLRRDFFSTVVSESLVQRFFTRSLSLTLNVQQLIKNPATGKFTFEAVLFLCVLASFHRSDAARLNPYLRRLSACEDVEFFQKVNWATNFALNAAIQSYRNLSDDTPSQNLASGIVSLFASWRPDKALASTPIDPPKELFKDQPIEAAIALLPVFELGNTNSAFSVFSAQAVHSASEEKFEGSGRRSFSVVVLTTISLSSYILTHASSGSTQRTLGYAMLSLKTLLCFVGNVDLLPALFIPIQYSLQLSRQRLPTLPLHDGPRPSICAVLDCCVLWLRHNLQYKLEAAAYILSVNIVQRMLWYLRVGCIRLEYDWKDLWSATLGLLNFISSRAQSITAAIDIGNLIEEAVALLEYALSQAEKILPSAKALHELIYELIRSSASIQKLRAHVRENKLDEPSSQRRTAWINARSTEERLNGIMKIIDFYQAKIAGASIKTAKEAMRVVAREIESEGLHAVPTTLDLEPPKRVEDAVGFLRDGYTDILALMP